MIQFHQRAGRDQQNESHKHKQLPGLRISCSWLMGFFQSLYIIRHGDRFDYSYPQWKESASRPGDPPLSDLGHQQARETGVFLSNLLTADGIKSSDVTFLSSPFLRCLETSTDLLSQFSLEDSSSIKILPEYSVFEIDSGHDAHKCLPTLEERACYFPKLDQSYTSISYPSLPGNPLTLTFYFVSC